MPKITALALGGLLVLGTAPVMARSDTGNLGGAPNKEVGRCCSQFQILAEEKALPEKGRSKRSAGEDYDPATSPQVCDKKTGKCNVISTVRKGGSTGPTAPPKPVGSNK
jgi:hypothetical protein